METRNNTMQSPIDQSIIAIVNHDTLAAAKSAWFNRHAIAKDIQTKNPTIRFVIIQFNGEQAWPIFEIEPLASPMDLLTPALGQEIDLNALYQNKHPVYLTAMSDQSVLFANPAALAAQQKTPQEFLGENAASLNFPDELERRDEILEQDGSLIEYEYEALRWYKDGPLWKRRHMNFISNFRVVNYLGVKCRLSEVLAAQPLSKLV